MSSSNFAETVASIRQKIEAYLEDLTPTAPRSLYDPVRRTIAAGGKRVRPILTALAARLTSSNDAWVPAAAAVELLHTFTLVHDDFMDNAPTRRGQPTVHVEFGASTAILAGDALIALATKALSEAESPFVRQMLVEFAKGFQLVCDGQALDKEFETRDDISETEYLAMIDLKTAKVLELSAVLGGLSGGNLHTEDLRSFAHHLGLAFQLMDDLLDLTADEADFGKTRGGDILEGKRTLLFVEAMSQYDGLSKDEQNLMDRIRCRRAVDSDVPAARSLFERLGVLETVSRYAERETRLAWESLARIPASPAREDLEQLSEALLRRSS